MMIMIGGSQAPRAPSALSRLGVNLISKHLQFVNLVEENVLHSKIFISNIKENLKLCD
jgi:hypothetical protein